MERILRNSVSRGFKGLRGDCSLSALVAGLIAVTVSYAGPLLIVFQASDAAGLSYDQLSSWVWAISIGSGITAIILSLWFRTPVITAFSTPGAVLLVSSWGAFSYNESIGAFIFSAAMITIFGLSGLFSRLMEKVPYSIVTAMLAGILLNFGVNVFVSVKQSPVLVLLMAAVYLLSKRFIPRYSTVFALCTGVLTVYAMNRLDFSGTVIELARPVFTTPQFSLHSIISLGIPLFIVAMASQNAPGIAVLRAEGYETPASPLVSVTGIASLLLAPFGAHGLNLAAITSAICTGKEAHAQPEKRYVAGVSCGIFYLIFGIFGATIVSVFSAFPAELITVIAGLALLASLSSNLTAAMSNAQQRDSALITFLVTISGITIFGIGAAFWGLVAGIAAHAILHGSWRKKASPSSTGSEAK